MDHGRVRLGQVVLCAMFVTVVTLVPSGGALVPSGGARADSSLRFRNVTKELGITSGSSRQWGSTFVDYDRNGYSDILLGRHWRSARLFAGTGPGFEARYPAPLNVSGFDRHGCAWGEANGDRRPDLYCVQGADKGQGEGPNQLAVQTPDADLRDVTKAFRVVDRYGRGRTANWMDVDGDGDLDLFVGNLNRTGHPNRLYINKRGWFRSVNRGLARETKTMSSSWADWDRDGDPDLLLNQYYGAPTILYRNNGGRFRPYRLPGISGGPWQSGAWGDFDADGWVDLHVMTGRSSRIFRNVKGGMKLVHRTSLRQGRMSVWLNVDNDRDLDLFIVQGAPGRNAAEGGINATDVFLIRGKRGFRKTIVRGTRGPSTGNGDSVSTSDYDRDMRMDLYVTNGMDHWKGVANLYRNVGAGRHAAEIRLSGTRWNPWGLGARIKIRRPGSRRVLWHHVTDRFTFRSQSDASFVHVGLGRYRRARAIVLWPGGARDCRMVFAGKVVRIQRDSHPC
jgi:hypothetical protein